MTRPAARCLVLTTALLSVGVTDAVAQDSDAAPQWRTDPEISVWSQVASTTQAGAAIASPAELELSLVATESGPQAALPLADALLRQDRWNPIARRVRFLSLFIDGDYAGVLADADACQAEQIDLLDCDFYAALAHARLGELPQGQALLERHVQFAHELPDAALLRRNLAEIYLAQGAIAEARVLYARGLSDTPYDNVVLAGLVAALVAGGEFSQAEDTVREALLTPRADVPDPLPGTEWLVDGMDLPQRLVEARLVGNLRLSQELEAALRDSDFGRSLSAGTLQAFLDRNVRPEGRAVELLGIPCAVRLASVNAARTQMAVLCDDGQVRVGRIDGEQTTGWVPARGPVPADRFVSLAWTPDDALRLLAVSGGLWAWTSPADTAPEFTQLSRQLADGIGAMTVLSPDGERVMMLRSGFGTEAWCRPADGSGTERRVFISYEYGDRRSLTVSNECMQAAWLSGSTLWHTDAAGTPQTVSLPRLAPSAAAVSADGARVLIVSGQHWVELRDSAVFQSGQLPMVITSVWATPSGFVIAAGQRVWWLDT